MNKKIVSNPPPTILHLAYVGTDGNAGGGQYRYSFTPDVRTFCKGQCPAILRYEFAEEVARRFKMEAVLTSDSLQQLEKIEIEPDAKRFVTLHNRNDRTTLIFLSILVRDTEREVLISCDPEIGNVPDVDP